MITTTHEQQQPRQQQQQQPQLKQQQQLLWVSTQLILTFFETAFDVVVSLAFYSIEAYLTSPYESRRNIDLIRTLKKKMKQ